VLKMKPIPIEPQPGQESVWDYPRPAILQDTSKQIKVVCNDLILAETLKGKRVLETSHPPVYYIPAVDVKLEYLIESTQRTWCEWKGWCQYYDVSIDGKYIAAAAWRYYEPTPSFVSIQNYYSFYARLMDACFINNELIVPQPGDFYAGWITSDIVGPFKGEPGTKGW
jgi:uncharacterized protein (DUF427 family)